MAEYINRGNAKHAFAVAFKMPENLIDAVWIQEVLDAIPAVDVRPVVQGRWMTKEYIYGDKSVGIGDAWIERVAETGECAYCSNCKEYAKLDGAEEYALTPFCPNCGAIMEVDDG